MNEHQLVHITLQNFVFGQAHLLDLALPVGWHLQRGFSHPEIHAAHTRQGASWVVAADAWYVLRHEREPWLLEFHLQVRARPYASPPDSRTLTVHGHAGWWRSFQVRRGLPWRRRNTPGLELSWYCPRTERAFRLRVVGRVPEQALAALRQAWTQSQCHRPTQATASG